MTTIRNAIVPISFKKSMTSLLDADKSEIPNKEELITHSAILLEGRYGAAANPRNGVISNVKALIMSINNGEQTLIQSTHKVPIKNLLRTIYGVGHHRGSAWPKRTRFNENPALLKEIDLNGQPLPEIIGFSYDNQNSNDDGIPDRYRESIAEVTGSDYTSRANTATHIRVDFGYRYPPNMEYDETSENDTEWEHETVNVTVDKKFITKHGNVLVQGVAGCGKSHLLKKLQEEYNGNVEVVVFHPSTTYEDFVRGLRPTGTTFEVRDGIFLDLCKKAAKNPEADYLLFIDEINRANTARVLGDLMLVLEKSKRRDFRPDTPALDIKRPVPGDGESFESVKLQLAATTAESEFGTEVGNQYLTVPSNLHVVGTMNTTDRSTGTIDLALQRRFKVVVQRPLSGQELKDALLEDVEAHAAEAGYLSNDDDHHELNDRVAALVDWWAELNDNLEDQVGPDAMVGHSYFFSTIGFDYPEYDDESTDSESENELKRTAYLDNVTQLVLNQLAEIALLFNISPSTLSNIQTIDWEYDDIPSHGVEHRGKGLGAMPQIVPWTSEDEQPNGSDSASNTDED